MKIASVRAEQGGETDRLLSEIADKLQAQGRSIAGIVKEMSYSGTLDNGCDVKVRVLPDGAVIKITQNLGTGSNACRLDPAAIADAVSTVESGALDDPELFILNKFGPEEAAGRGFCAVIGRALEMEIPVLVGVGNASQAAFDRFAEGLAETLPAKSEAVLGWCCSVIGAKTPRVGR